MADNKRNSVSSKVATPKTTNSSSPAPKDTLEALAKAIGGRITITTVAPATQTIEGTLYTACPVLNVVAIETAAAPSSASANYHIVPVSRIQSFQLLNLPTNPASNIGPVNLKRARDRVAARVKALKEQEETRGKGVTKEAQSIFDALKRVNIPIRWHGQQMIVHEAVIIAPPYRPEDCKGSKDKQQVLNQVKKVLEGERRKLKEREEREKKADAGQRKGG